MKAGKIRITIHIGPARLEWNEDTGYSKKELKLAVRAIAAMMSGLKVSSHIAEAGWEV